MLRLKVTGGNAAGTEIKVEDDFLIGRNAEGEGKLADDIEISREHARISGSDVGGYVIEDLGSTNGTFVNGHQIREPEPLGAGDVVEVGGTRLVVQVTGPPPAPPPTEPGPEERFAPTRVGAVPTDLLDKEGAAAPATEPGPEAPPTEEAAPAPPAEAPPAPPAEAPPAPVAEPPPAPREEPAPTALGRLSLRLDLDLEAGEASIEIEGSSERVELVHEDGRWQLKAPS
jgi:predicted component of type VI protein secretion system